LAFAAGAVGQSPGPVAAPPVLPSPAPITTGATITGSVPGGAVVSDCCLTTKCPRVPCTPEVKPVYKTVYGTTCREFCVPTCSLLDHLLSKCGLTHDGGECGGETRTKTLLVKKLVPKCEEGCDSCQAPAPPPVVLPAPPPPVKH
jgi:hypothetical protein